MSNVGSTGKMTKGVSEGVTASGKGKSRSKDYSMNDDSAHLEDEEMVDDDEGNDDDDDDDADAEGEEEEAEEVEDDYEEIDPSAITSRRTRGRKVDYNSQDALAKAGLQPEDNEEDDD